MRGVMKNTDRSMLHLLNGQLVTALQRVFPTFKWDEWIINAIMLHRQIGEVERVVFQTSATWCLGTLFDRQEQCGPEQKVKTLDMDVPLKDSLAGYCVRSNDVVWIDDLPSLSISDPLKGLYRGFQFVGVFSPQLPNAEYVFPIRVIVGMSSILLGVLNCEWYSPAARASATSPFYNLHRNVVNDFVLKLLQSHANFLAVALNEDASQTSDYDGILKFHEETLDRCIARLRGGDEEYQSTSIAKGDNSR